QRHALAGVKQARIGQLDPPAAALQRAGAGGQHVPGPVAAGTVEQRDDVAVVGVKASTGVR
ncbi:MAG TPA: hypothetical protein VGJ54_12445, partial [Streptosporangiaceae bacterium]